jgi:mannose-1-phosphate guanylyltransferase/mannose-6-phosphate isomerase
MGLVYGLRMIPVVISGGSGTRLWPVSRTSYPKQFCEFYDKSFLHTTLDRVSDLGSPPLILTVESMRSMTLRVLKSAGLSEDSLICEPYGKNTAPAIALLCHVLSQQGKNSEVVGVFPADHLITEVEKFRKVVKLAEKLAPSTGVVTLGIEPKYPATGYGYIEVDGDPINEEAEFPYFKVKQFCEKPSFKKAQSFVQTRKHFWNSGMFIFQVSKMISNFKIHMPEMWQRIEKIKPDLSNASAVYANFISESIDYGMMEKLTEQIHIPSEMLWSDVGSWDEISRLANEFPSYRLDSKAKIFSEDSSQNFIFSIKEKVVSLIGVQNLIVVDTPDALLITQKGQSEKVKGIVNQLREAGMPEGNEQTFEIRPWGQFEILGDSPDFKVKKITVDPGERLSYQSHQKRKEHWVVISGEATILINDVEKKLFSGESIVIPQGAKHRIQNFSKVPLVLVEVQTGSYFGEDDITRYDDEYKRN